MKNRLLIVATAFTWLCIAQVASGATAITTDSRIKTFVYNENEVFHITVHYGYITSIEFPKNEDILTIAPGNGYSWKFIKDGQRLFIKSLEGAAQTNVTIITTKHTYQIELESRSPSDGIDEQLVYVVRFFYPDALLDKPRPAVDTNRFTPQSFSGSSHNSAAPDLYSPPPPSMTEGIKTSQSPADSDPFASSITSAQSTYNFNYTLTGPDRIAPLKVFDNGAETLLQFPDHNALIPHLFVIGNDGKETQASYTMKGDYIALTGVVQEIVLRLDRDEVHVYNERYK